MQFWSRSEWLFYNTAQEACVPLVPRDFIIYKNEFPRAKQQTSERSFGFSAIFVGKVVMDSFQDSFSVSVYS